MVGLNNKRVWKRHVDHVRRDNSDSPTAIPLSVCVPHPPPAPSVRPANDVAKWSQGRGRHRRKSQLYDLISLFV